MTKLLRFFETKPAAVFCLLLAIVSRTVNVLFVSYTGRDKMILVMQSKSFLQGRGFVIPEYFTGNPYSVVYDHTPYWPPGYPLLLSPFLKIFQFDIYKATTVLDILVCIALIFVIRKLARQAGFSSAAVNLVTLLAGCFDYSFISESLPTDTVSLLFLLLALSFTIKTVVSGDVKPAALLLGGFLLFLPNFFRYAYPGASLAIPLTIMVTGWLIKQKTLIRKGGGLLAGTLLFLAVFFVYVKISTGSSSYTSPTEKGLFFENIVHWHPAVPAAFLNLPFISSQLFRHFSVSLNTFLGFLEIVNVISILLLATFFIVLVKKKYFRKPGPFEWFLLTGFFVSVTVFASLGYLSLTHALLVGTAGGAWNYISEPRYFAFIFVFVQFCFIAVLFRTRWKKRFLTAVLLSGGLFFLLAEIAHTVYFNSKLVVSFDKYKSAVSREKDYRYMIRLIKETEVNKPGYDIMTAGYRDAYFGYIGTYMGHYGISDPVSFNDHLPAVKRKTILLVMIYHEDKPGFKEFFDKNAVREVKSLNESSFYTVEINPSYPDGSSSRLSPLPKDPPRHMSTGN